MSVLISPNLNNNKKKIGHGFFFRINIFSDKQFNKIGHGAGAVASAASLLPVVGRPRPGGVCAGPATHTAADAAVARHAALCAGHGSADEVRVAHGFFF